MGFKVYDTDGNDVTQNKQWFLGTDGTLYFLTNDIDDPLAEAGDGGYWYSMD